MKRLLVLSAILFLVIGVCKSQDYHKEVFPDKTGEELKSALIRDYKTFTVLSYSKARDTFMGTIDLQDGVLECLYSGYQIEIKDGQDPTQAAFAQGVNTEHVVPRSRGATLGTNAYSDMHHLFAVRADINTIRGNFPLGEIEDSKTQKWYIDNRVQHTIPTENIDGYTEAIVGERLEPREIVKGNIARAIFYFQTMYESQAESAAPGFFESQRMDLCNWHFQDPVDSLEWLRNKKIAKYQNNKENPFVLDCRLARLYCPEIQGSCQSVSTDNQSVNEGLEIVPNPFYARFQTIADTEGELKLYRMDGTLILEKKIEVGTNTVEVDQLPRGKYVAVFTLGESRYSRIIEKL